jgi:hypothetical protein
MNKLRTSKRWRWLAGAFLAGLFLFFVFPLLLPKGQRWYVLNPRYALWRYGWYSYDHRIVYQGLNGDIWRDEVVRGKTVSELRAMFSEIHDISEFDSYALGKVSSLTNSTRTFVKWADTDWFIELINGRATAIHLWKG